MPKHINVCNLRYPFTDFLFPSSLIFNGAYMDIGHCILDANANAVEFCPHDSFDNVLVASTYVLQKDDCPSRSCSITLFDVDDDGGGLELIQKLYTSGIFYIKWSPWLSQYPSFPLLAQADANGYVKIYSLQCSYSGSSKLHGNCLNEPSSKHISSSMCLCINWNSSAISMTVGLSDGSISIILLNESELNISQEWKAHYFELWATSFDTPQLMQVYTRSDDCKFCCWDMREDPSQLVFQSTKAHKMGSCCIAKSPHDPNILITGRYDESLRIWDIRSISKPVNESSIGLGEGVWRVKHHPSILGLVLTACMHNGFAIVNIQGDQAQVVDMYEKHGSLAYGADWQMGDPSVSVGKKCPAIATCSFYDRLLCVWISESDVFV